MQEAVTRSRNMAGAHDREVPAIAFFHHRALERRCSGVIANVESLAHVRRSEQSSRQTGKPQKQQSDILIVEPPFDAAFDIRILNAYK
jgi:hypothetical protein